MVNSCINPWEAEGSVNTGACTPWINVFYLTALIRSLVIILFSVTAGTSAVALSHHLIANCTNTSCYFCRKSKNHSLLKRFLSYNLDVNHWCTLTLRAWCILRVLVFSSHVLVDSSSDYKQLQQLLFARLGSALLPTFVSSGISD